MRHEKQLLDWKAVFQFMCFSSKSSPYYILSIPVSLLGVA